MANLEKIETHSSLEPCPTKGPIKSQFVCLSGRPSVRLAVSSAFFSRMAHYFFKIFGAIVDNLNTLKLKEPFSPGKFIFTQICANRAQNGPKIVFLGFFEKFCH